MKKVHPEFSKLPGNRWALWGGLRPDLAGWGKKCFAIVTLECFSCCARAQTTNTTVSTEPRSASGHVETAVWMAIIV